MPAFDESSLRKASAWQDFKEAQGLLESNAEITGETTADGWRGAVKIGNKTYRTSVVAKSPTWFEAKCSCPANQRQGTFCCHAIAIGLTLLRPIQPTSPPKPQPTAKAPAQSPAIAWQIRFQGAWLSSLTKARASISLSHSNRPPTPSDEKITSWLSSLNSLNSHTIPLSLSNELLETFLNLASNHPEICSIEGAVQIDSGAIIHLDDCLSQNQTIQLIPPTKPTIQKIGSSFFSITPQSISKIGDQPPPTTLIPTLNDLTAGKTSILSLESFLNHLPALSNFVDFSSSAWFASLQFVPATPDFLLVVSGSESKLSVTLSTTYSQSLPSLQNTLVNTQNPQAESQVNGILSRVLVPSAPSLFHLTDPERIRSFLTEHIPNLPPSWSFELSPSIQKLASSYITISPKISILHSDQTSLEFNLSFETNHGETISRNDVIKLLRSKNSHKNQHISFSTNIENLIDPLFEDLDIEQLNGRFISKNASAEIIREITEKLSHSSSTKSEFTSPQLIHNPPIKANLRLYQLHGLSWIVDRLNKYKGALLADDMGLGKTIQTIACIEHFFSTYSQSSPALVIVTTSLLGNWKSEFQRFAPQRRVITLHGPSRDSLRETIQPTDVILTTYSTLARDLAWHLRQCYSVAVIDEASLIRNPDTDHSKAVAKLDATHRIALTGTPIENSARDLWSIFRFIQPGWLGTRSHFQERYETPLKTPETRDHTATLLKLKTSPFTLRRTKSEVASELPSKIQIDEFCDLSRDQSETYRSIQKEGLKLFEDIRSSGQTGAAHMQALTTLLRLRQTCCDLALLDSEKLRSLPVPNRSAKLERLLEITEQSIAAGSRILVFSQFRQQLLEIGKALDSSEIPHLRLDGQTTNRQELVDSFQSPDGPPVFLISLKAGGYGLNLTSADVVIHFDPWWNPAAEAQATDRAHRIGQTKPVTVFRLLTRGTVEEQVIRLQAGKKALADSIDEIATPIQSSGWSSKEIEQLLFYPTSQNR